MHIKIIHSIVISLLLIFSVSVAFADDIRASTVSTMLYPETKGWVDVASQPNVDRKWLDQWQPNLRSVYEKNMQSDESGGCSTITRLLNNNDFSLRISLIDIDADGIKDVIYAGHALCGEGALSIIWYGSNSESGRWTISDSEIYILNVEVLRLLPEPETKISSLEPGCCGAPTDRYLIGYLHNPYRLQRLSVLNGRSLVFPKKLLSKPKRNSVQKKSTLRYSPVELDGYDESMSEFLNHAIFGNVQRKYLPGINVLVLGKKVTDQGEEWHFVIVDQSYDRLVYHSPYQVNVGWIRYK